MSFQPWLIALVFCRCGSVFCAGVLQKLSRKTRLRQRILLRNKSSKVLANQPSRAEEE